jgi:hypothetical protein
MKQTTNPAVEMQDPIDEMKFQPAKRRGSVTEGSLQGTHCHPGH